MNEGVNKIYPSTYSYMAIGHVTGVSVFSNKLETKHLTESRSTIKFSNISINIYYWQNI